MNKGLTLMTLTLIWLMWGCYSPKTLAKQSVATFTPAFRTAEQAHPTRITDMFTETLKPATATPDIAGTVVAMSKPRIDSSLSSPDGKWRAEIVIHDCVLTGELDENAYEELRLVQVDTNVIKVVDDQLQNCGGLGAFGLEGLFWSPNSRYFYYTNAREGFPDGCGYWERPILRLDVNNLQFEYLGGGPNSPDGTKLATWQGYELVIWNINEDEIARFPAISPDAQIGPIAWSQDNQALVYFQVESYCPLAGKSYLVRLDLSKLSQAILLESNQTTFGYVSWDSPNELRLFDENGKEWHYEFDTKDLEQVP